MPAVEAPYLPEDSDADVKAAAASSVSTLHERMDRVIEGDKMVRKGTPGM
ncbi:MULTISPECIES: hypothetical protein [unclassified Mesorhizobium]|nr:MULTISPECIES: hypothetical protein [unclassified Mesorhizobium]